MGVHRVQGSTGEHFEIAVDDSGRITDVAGNWPEGGDEFTLEAPLPAHSPVADPPEHIRAYAEEHGLADVCFYDPDHCRTCFCDDKGGMRCSGMC